MTVRSWRGLFSSYLFVLSYSIDIFLFYPCLILFIIFTLFSLEAYFLSCKRQRVVDPDARVCGKELGGIQ